MKNKRGLFLILTGLLLVAAAFLLAGYNVREESQAEQSASAAVIRLEEAMAQDEPEAADADGAAETGIPDYIFDPTMPMPTETIDGRDYIGVLEIPACELTLPVISDWSYPALKEAPCRYAGSAYQDDLILAGHNYRSHFGKLQNLAVGDTVRFTDVSGNIFTYKVAEHETLAAADVEEMESGDWDLTLFTCDYSGQNRLTVRCVRTDVG